MNFMYVGPLDAGATGATWTGPVAALLRRQLPGRHHGRRAHALAPDFDRAVLGVPGMNYHAAAALRGLRPLRPRQHRGRRHALGLYDSYPNELERPLLLSLIQLLGTAARRTATRTTSRATAAEHPGAQRAHACGVRRPPGGQRDRRGGGAHDRRVGSLAGVAPGRHTDVNPYFGIPHRRVPVRRLGDGAGTRASRPRPPRTRRRARGKDPHGAPRATARTPQKS